ncbi:hypothetical protein NQ318_006727 [Aromia moschata]|uniref:Uncharacterized protein n=1 Tax=Aromia moschata TaxID=1265417 RepID=A0AAV8YDC7_9CUCU|nr:hypothetical protein NQ318_006727 [Aromia moschata]
MNLCQTNPGLHQQILFSDEVLLWYWRRTNPHWIIEAHTQYPQNLNVWAGIVANRIIGPFFFEETLTGERYLEFLQNDLVPALAVIFPNENDPDIPDNTLWFPQDGDFMRTQIPHNLAKLRDRIRDEMGPLPQKLFRMYKKNLYTGLHIAKKKLMDGISNT